jgi:thiamine biosynthesis lipoprotein ApbE
MATDSARAGILALAAQAIVTKAEPSGSGRNAAGAVDEIADTLRAYGMHDAMIALPGVARALGASRGSEAWSLPLHDPLDRIAVIGRLRLAGGEALATSTLAEAPLGLIGVAVVAEDARAAALWSATLIALDPGEARIKAKQHPEIAAILIEASADGRSALWVESGLRDRFIVDAQAQSSFRVESF